MGADEHATGSEKSELVEVLSATSENDALIGYASADSISGLAGDDAINARLGNDTARWRRW